MAVVVTYCRRSPHDRYFFDDPLRLLGGTIEAPAFNLRNPLDGRQAYSLGHPLGVAAAVPNAGRIGREGAGRSSRSCSPSSFAPTCWTRTTTTGKRRPARRRLKVLLDEMKDSLADRLVALFAQHWPAEAAELASRTGHRTDD